MTHGVNAFHLVFTDSGEVYTWGWKECVPSGRVFGDPSTGTSLEKDVFERQSSFLTEQGKVKFGNFIKRRDYLGIALSIAN